MNLLVVNQPLNNRGDESAHRGLIRAFLKDLPNVRVQVLFVAQNQNSIDQFSVGNSQVSYTNIHPCRGFGKIWKLALKKNWMFLLKLHPTTRRLIAFYKNADFVVCAPGGICMGGFQNWEHLLMLSIAKFLKKPLAYYGRSFGPFPVVSPENRLFKKISLELLNYCSFISIRDKKSEKLAKTLGIEYVPTVDSAFLDAPKVDIPQEIISEIGTSPYIVFVPNLLVWHYMYKGKTTKEKMLYFYSEVFKRLVVRFSNHKIVMLPQTFNYGCYDDDDVCFFRDFAEYVNDDRIIVVSDTYSSDVQQTLISGAECLIGARYHSVVFAINQETPFIALSYEHKIAGLLETLHKEECMIDITSTFESEENMQRTLELFSINLGRLSESSARNAAKTIALACMDAFVKKIA